MDASVSVGDILAAALTRSNEDDEREQRDEIERWAMVTAAEHLSRAIADTSTLTAEEAFSALKYIPDACLPLLTLPHGWTALAILVVTDLQAIATGTVQPTVH